jgi:hypothetical protein
MVVRDLGIVVSLFGALLGSLIVFVFPAQMYMALLRKRAGPNGVSLHAAFMLTCLSSNTHMYTIYACLTHVFACFAFDPTLHL